MDHTLVCQPCPPTCILCRGRSHVSPPAIAVAARRVLRAALADGRGTNVNWPAVVDVAQALCLMHARAGTVLSTPLLRAPRELDGPRSALAVAVEEDKPHYVALLLQRGADPNAVKFWCDDTPLIICAGFRGNTHVAQLLLAHGAHVDGMGVPLVRNHNHHNALAQQQAKQPDITTTTTCHHPSNHTLLHTPPVDSEQDENTHSGASYPTAQSPTPSMTRKRSRRNSNNSIHPVHPSDIPSATAALSVSQDIHRRTPASFIDVATTAISSNTAQPAQNNVIESLTALGVAAYRGHVDLVNLLLSHGANVRHVEAVDGCSVLHLAAQGSRPASAEHIRIADALIQCGADPCATDYQGNTPADVARVAGDKALYAFLHFHAERSAYLESGVIVPSNGRMRPFVQSLRCCSDNRNGESESLFPNLDVDWFIRAAKRSKLTS